MKAMIIPGNHNTNIHDIWFSYIKTELTKLGLEVIAENMPDPDLARKEYWLPFMEENLSGHHDILIGHSTGAVAILRYLENHTCTLAILVGVYHSDLGDEYEKKSGYFATPWNWQAIRKNADKIIIFASRDDPYIPIEQAQFIKEQTNGEYHEYRDEGHFGEDANKTCFPEIVTSVYKTLEKISTQSAQTK